MSKFHILRPANSLILEFNPDFPLVICMQLFREIVKTVHIFIQGTLMILDSMSDSGSSLCRLEFALDDDKVFLNSEHILKTLSHHKVHLMYDADQMYRILQAANEFDRIRWKVPFGHGSQDFMQIVITNEDLYFWSVNLSLLDTENDPRKEPLEIPDFSKVRIILTPRQIRETVNHFSQFADALELSLVLEKNFLIFHAKTELIEMNYVLKAEDMLYQTSCEKDYYNFTNQYQLSLLRKFVQMPCNFVEKLEWYLSPKMPLGIQYQFTEQSHFSGFLGIFAS